MSQPTAVDIAMIAATLDVDEEEVDWMKAQPKWRDLPRSELRCFQRINTARKLLILAGESQEKEK